MSTRGRFLGGIAAAAVLPAVPASAAGFDSVPNSTATIGIAGPFTGNDRHLGEQLLDGARQACDDTNAMRSGFDRIYTVRTFDDQNMVAQGPVAAQFAVDDSGVIAMIGHLRGRVTEAALRTYVGAQLPVIVPTSTYEHLTELGYGGVLRLATKDSTEGDLAARYAEELAKPTAAAILFQDGDYGFNVASGFADRMHGDKIPYVSVKFSWEKPDFDEATQRALAGNPDLIFLAGVVSDMGPLLDTLAAAKYAGRLTASQGFFSSPTADKYAKSAEGLVVSTSIPPFQLAPGDLRIIQGFEQNYGDFTPTAAFGYAAAQIIISAVRRAGAADRYRLWRILQVPSAYDTIAGQFSFLSTGDPIQPNSYFYEIKDGKWRYKHAARHTGFLVR